MLKKKKKSKQQNKIKQSNKTQQANRQTSHPASKQTNKRKNKQTSKQTTAPEIFLALSLSSPFSLFPKNTCLQRTCVSRLNTDSQNTQTWVRTACFEQSSSSTVIVCFDYFNCRGTFQESRGCSYDIPTAGFFAIFRVQPSGQGVRFQVWKS